MKIDVFTSLIVNNAVLPFTQSDLLLFNQNFNYWPQNAGWESVKRKNNDVLWWYIYDNDSWKVLQSIEKQEGTKSYIAKNTISTNVTKQIREKSTVVVSKIYFYILLLLAFVFLWVEAKVSQVPQLPSEKNALNN